MNRKISMFIAIVAFVVAMAIPASAVEANQYSFENYSPDGDMWWYFRTDSVLPSGKYSYVVTFQGQNSSTGVLEIADSYNQPILLLESSDSNLVSYTYEFVGGETRIAFGFYDGCNGLEPGCNPIQGTEYYMTLTELPSASTDGSNDLSISDVVTSDSLDGVYDEILGIVPIVFVVLISFLGIRKGIAFLLDILHKA